jgi:hypothetical protein
MISQLTQKQKIEKLQLAAKTDLRFLCKHILRMDDWDTLHDDLAKVLEHSDSRKLILMPRGHLKSSVITVGWVIQQILRDPNIRVLISNAVWDKARAFLAQISGYLTDKSALPQLFGPFQTPQGRWTRDEIEIAQKTKTSIKEPTISTAGLEKSLTGYHYDLLVMDDLVDATNITTKEQIEKVKAFYRNSLPLLDPGGRIVTVGTRWAISDLYDDLITQQATVINGHKLTTPEERLDWRKWIPQ